MNTIIQDIIVWAPSIIFAITLHEWAHGYMASRFGDPTPAFFGRLTLNPLPHIDMMWTVVIPIAMLVSSLLTTGNPIVFGGAKPVPINPRKFKGSARVAMFWVAIAGPLVNLLLALVAAVLIRYAVLLPNYFLVPIGRMLLAVVHMNVLLAVFNLLPMPPLDGGRVAVALLPSPLDRYLAALERYGLPIILVLAFTGQLSYIIGPMMNLLDGFFMRLTGLDL
ncbi:MAG: site-2 protease family protein [Magnetococcus sp. DMHC-6]